MSDIMDFSFDDGKVVQSQGMEKFKQEKPGQISRVSVIAFKTHVETIYSVKAKEKGSPLTDEEKAEYNQKVDIKLAENLKKSVEELTEVDRLNLRSPRFSLAWTHYGEGIGTIRCLSERDRKGDIVKPALCCKVKGRLQEAEQKIATLVLVYPMNDGSVDIDLFKQKKYTRHEVWKLNPKKFTAIQSAYKDAQEKQIEIPDLKVTLSTSGDPKYQNQTITDGPGAVWARDDIDPELRFWALSKGIKGYKFVQGELGFKMSLEKLTEKLNGSSGALNEGAASASNPQLQTSYNNLID